MLSFIELSKPHIDLELYGTDTNIAPIKVYPCQGHYDFSFSDFYFIFVCCVEASK